ncbi:hypothetical protein AAHE18_11G055600 [Arachis hypogaea]
MKLKIFSDKKENPNFWGGSVFGFREKKKKIKIEGIKREIQALRMSVTMLPRRFVKLGDDSVEISWCPLLRHISHILKRVDIPLIQRNWAWAFLGPNNGLSLPVASIPGDYKDFEVQIQVTFILS